jgi:serine/threonine protein kinase/tetratricopeptide (TPR) repeat protein
LVKSEETIFAEALGKGSALERDAYLDQACAGNAELRRAVEALLLAHQEASGILEAPPPGLDVSVENRPSTEGVGSPIGPYKLLEQIGGGGMGVVYMAEQLRPVRRKVALKIIKPGMDSGQVIARFEAERQALTMMDHPNIAKVLDAGTTDAGRPYFVMELVKGIPITDYCDQARLTTRERLELFMQVCHAMQHAHQKGVIHRDLKPTNVLVTLHDDKPVPKVIDFGIAKAAGHVLTNLTLFTNYAQMLGTPLYMSPEQAQISGLDVDTRSDVYSLGVLLYELLTGTTPFDKQRLHQAAYDEMRRIIREENPPKPSTRLSSMGAKLTTISAHRHTNPKRLGQLVRGELDWIVMKALEKERSRRYETANGFARDIERYLADEPVEACPPSAWYRFRKFARRHSVALATALALVVAVLLAVAGLVANNRLVRRERNQKESALSRVLQEKERADQNLVRARQAVKEHLTLTAGNQRLKEGDFHELRRNLLESAIPFYEEFVKQKSDDPALEVERGRAYGDLALVREELGQFDQALSAHERRRDIFEGLVARFPSKPAYRQELANSYRSVATSHLDQAQHAQAESAFRQATTMLEALTSQYPSEAAYRQDLAGAYNNLGVLLRALGRHDEALEVHHKAAALRERLASEFPTVAEYRRDLAESLANLSSVLNGLGKNDESLALNQRAVELVRKLAEEHPTSPQYQEMWGMGLDNQSTILDAMGRRDESLGALQQALRINEKLAADFRSVPGYRHGLAVSLMNLSVLQTEMGRLDDGLASCDKAIEILEKLAGEAPNVAAYPEALAQTYHNRAELQRRMNRLEPALDSSRKALSIQEKLTAEHPTVPKLREDLALSHNAVGEILNQLGRYDESNAAYEKALPIREALASKFPSVVDYAVNLAATYASFGTLNLTREKYQLAIEWYDKALSKLSPVLAAEPKLSRAQWYAADIYNNRAMALNELNRYPEALKDLEQALALEDIENRVAVRLLRAKTMAHLKMHGEATTEAEAVVAGIPDLPDQLYQEAAGVYAISSGMVREDPALSEKYAARGVALLRRAFEKDHRVAAESVANDKDLAVLRLREDFKKLSNEWKAKQQ